MTVKTSSPSSDQARLAALYQVSQSLGVSLNLHEALTTTLDAAIRLTGGERGFLMLFDDDSGQLVFRLARNSAQQNLDESLFEISRSVVHEVARSGTPVVTENAQVDPRFAGQESVMGFGLRSVMAVPLNARSQTRGVLYVDNKARDGLFGPEDLALLNAFAGPAAMAIENARLFTQTDQALSARVSDLEFMQRLDRQLNATLDFERVMKQTLNWAVQRAAARGGWIGLVEETGVRVVAQEEEASAFPPDHPLVQAAVQTGEPQWHRPEGPQDTACLVAPVLREERVLAVVVVERGGHAFTLAGEEFLLRLADRAAIAIDNARLYAAIKQTNDAKSKFVSLVSHELKIPLTAIKGYSDLMRQGLVGPITEQQSHFLNIIRSNVERMSVLISDLSDISRIETGRLRITPGPLSLTECAAEALLSLKNHIDQKDQKLGLNLPDDLPRVYGDKSRLIQVLSNLISNAHKYSPAGALITVSAARMEAPPRVRLSVTDTGHGIAPEDQAKLFTQFFRSEDPAIREETGWGLGLHISKRLMELMGGDIGVESMPGKGSTFWFTVPVDLSGS